MQVRLSIAGTDLRMSYTGGSDNADTWPSITPQGQPFYQRKLVHIKHFAIVVKVLLPSYIVFELHVG